MARSPYGDDGGVAIEDVAACDCELSAEEQHAYRHTDEHATHHSIDEQEGIVGGGAVEIAFLPTEFIAYRLKHEAEEDSHPEPVGAAEGCGVKEGEGCEEGAAKHHEGGEGEFPLASERIHDKVFRYRPAGLKQKALAALDEEKEHEGSTEHGYEEPPIYL